MYITIDDATINLNEVFTITIFEKSPSVCYLRFIFSQKYYLDIEYECYTEALEIMEKINIILEIENKF